MHPGQEIIEVCHFFLKSLHQQWAFPQDVTSDYPIVAATDCAFFRAVSAYKTVFPSAGIQYTAALN